MMCERSCRVKSECFKGWEIDGLVVAALPNAVSVVIVCGRVEKYTIVVVLLHRSSFLYAVALLSFVQYCLPLS